MIHMILTFDQVYRSRWFRPLSALVVIAASGALGFLSVRYNPYLLLLAASVPLMLLGVDWLLRRLYWLPAIVLLSATLTNWDIGRGLTLALILATGLSVLWLLQQLLINRRLEFTSSPTLVPTFAFIAVALLSYGWSFIAADPFLVTWATFPFTQLGQLAIFVVSPLVMLLTASLVTQARHLKNLVYIFLIMMLIGGIAELFLLPVRLNMRGVHYTWMVCLAFGQLMYNQTMPRWQRGWMAALIAIWFLVSFLRGITWVSGWLPGMFAIVVLTFFKSKRLFVVLLLITILVGAFATTWIEERFGDEYNESGSTRLYRWQTVFELPFVWNNWLIGTGPAGYARYFMTYIPGNAMSTHSNYIDIFLQLGILGVVTLLWLIATLFWESVKLQKISMGDPFVVAYARSSLAMPLVILLAMFLGDWFTPFVYNQGLVGFSWTINSWIFLGALAAIPNLLNRAEPGQAEDVNYSMNEALE